MGRIEELAEAYRRHISTPWQRTIAGAQRVIMVIYDKELERTLRARMSNFEYVTVESKHDWVEVDVTSAFADWLASDEYRDAYFESPEDLQLKLEPEFTAFVAEEVRRVLCDSKITENTVVAIKGVGAVFGFAHVSQILKAVEGYIKGRLVVFFPGQLDNNNYRLLDARDGWNYLAVPITTGGGGTIA